VYSKKYRQFCQRIVGRMVEAFRGHPALHSWQIDNEMGGQDWGEEARRGFQEWLAGRYGSVEDLNRAWGLEFWSQAYERFDQVPMPTASAGSIEVPERHHPSLVFAAWRYNSAAWTDFIRAQCDVIRAGSDKPITTNMCGAALHLDWFDANRGLDRVGFSLYKDVLHYPWNVMFLDRMRAEKPGRPYWLLETAPNWSGGGKQWNIHHDARGLGAMTWMSTLLGGSMALYWQWREHWAGQEMQHGTCVTATGRWRPNREAWAGLAADFARHGAWLLAHPPAAADVALVLSTEAAWAFSIDPIDENMQYLTRWRDDHHLPLVRAHVWRDVVGEAADFGPYKVLLAPLAPILREETRARLRAWVAAGGRLVLGPLTGYRTEEFTAFRQREFGGLEDLIGATSSLRFTVHWVEDRVEAAFEDGSTTRTRAWCEGYAPTTGRPIARYAGGYGDGHVAAVENRFGRGAVITLGCMVSPEAYLGLVRRLMGEAGAGPVASGSGDVLVIPRAEPGSREVAGYGVVNLVEEERRVTLPAAGTDLLTGRPAGPDLALAPLEVLIVRIGD
jgi:beta-galactosidase GanA